MLYVLYFVVANVLANSCRFTQLLLALLPDFQGKYLVL